MFRPGPVKKLFPIEILDGLKRQQMITVGSLITLVIITGTIAIWLLHTPDSVKDPMVAVAKFNAFMAITTLSLNFILSTRSSVLEYLFKGLDRMYRVHKFIGRSSLFFMILHPFFLGLSKLPDRDFILEFLFPVGPIEVSTGVLSIYIFIILIALTISIRIPYHFWHNSHKLLGIVLVLAAFHAVAAGSDIQRYPLLMSWVILLSSAGIVSWLYMLLFYKRFGPRYSEKVVKVDHMHGITEIVIKKPPSFEYKPGQYIFIRFPRFEGIRELFPFSISNNPDQGTIRLSIRRGGDFTGSKVPLIRKGEKVIIMGPYGKFGERYLSHNRDMVWIAGGIGITPFLSLAKHETLHPTYRKIQLIWVMKEPKDAFHDSELFVEAKNNQRFDYQHWFSKRMGRIDTKDIIEMVGGKEEICKRIIFLCGPPQMMASLSKGLHKQGIPYKNLIYEDFDMLD